MASIEIPFVDLAPYHDSSSDPEQRKSAATSLAAALHTLGFVCVKNHGISDELLHEAFTWSKRLFSLSHQDKMKAPHPPTPMPHRGYSAPGLEKVYSVDEAQASDTHTDADAGRTAVRGTEDYKESYEIGSEEDPVQQNIWLPDDVLPGFRAFMVKYYWACNRAGDVLLTALADGLGLEGKEREFLLALNSQHENQLRLLHYPEVKGELVEQKVLARMPAHTDWGSVTLLWQDGVGGLELQHPDTGEWMSAKPVEGAAVINVADFLQRVTNGYLKSATHKVTLLESMGDGNTPERYSVPFFIGPPNGLTGKCLDTFVTKENPAKYDPLTYAEYAAWRAKHSY